MGDDLDLFDDELEDDLLEAADMILERGGGQNLIGSHLQDRAGRDFEDDSDIDDADLMGAEIQPTTFGPDQSWQSQTQSQRAVALRQTTLFGGVVDDVSEAVEGPRGPYRAVASQEPPTIHALDDEALKTWVYPLNLGPIRDYQYTIVKSCLYHNTLVALPTGLGKTFIAATVMLNYYRWTKRGKLIFVTPTKPLAAQQVDACLNVAGIPRSDATLLTGEVSPGLRVEEWENKRVFFMTPQTLQNDLSAGFADPKSIALLVVDEAHRATGTYAYVNVVKFIRRFSSDFRVMALTATPGSRLDAIQNVIDNLGISHIEIRTEDSMDIRQYIHSREVDQHILDPSRELLEISDYFGTALKPFTDKLSQQNIYWGSDPLSMTQYGLVKKQQDWFASQGRNRPAGIQFMVKALFSLLITSAVALKLLTFHGIKPFYDNMVSLRSEVEEAGSKGPKFRKALVNDANFQDMMQTIEKWLKQDDVCGHPKISVLTECVLNHFMDNSTQTSSTRIIVFSEYRDSAENIVVQLNKHRPMVRARVFVGQADSKRSVGMKQGDQTRTIEAFKKGEFNVLVATSIGEEGLDIGQVDLIVCYDASASPIRMLQRMGRTGRKRAGRVVLLLMRGKEQEKFEEAKVKYSEMQKTICSGNGLEYRHDQSRRIIPRNAIPEVDKRVVDIPPENTQTTALPVPSKNKTPKKRPRKKFHMPDGAIEGFVKASAVGQDGIVKPGRPKKSKVTPETDDVVDIPPLGKVELYGPQLQQFRKSCLKVPGHAPYLHMGEHLDANTCHYASQRKLLRTGRVKHGKYTKRVVQFLSDLADQDEWDMAPNEDGWAYRRLPVPEVVESDQEQGSAARRQKRPRQPASRGEPPDERRPRKKRQTKKAPVRRRGAYLLDEGDECRSDEVVPQDDSDDGEDLRDFIVSDDGEGRRTHKSTSPTSRGTATSDDLIVDAQSSSDGEMPTLSQLVSSSKKKQVSASKGSGTFDREDEMGEEEW